MHSVECVKVVADKVRVACSCGWESADCVATVDKSAEEQARELHLAHAAGA